MDASVAEYFKIILDILVATIIVVTIVFLAKRGGAKEQKLVGYRHRKKDEKYAGYAIFLVGIVIIAFSVLELFLLIFSNYYSEIPLGLTAIQMTTGSQTTDLLSGQILSYVFGISFWLMVFGLVGVKFFSIGVDLLKGKKITLKRKIKPQS
jgi:hypothetical protein